MGLSLTPAERSLRARAAAYALHSQGGTSTEAATAAQLARFDRQVDPDGSLDPAERARRARFALKSHMASLSLKASRAKARQRRRELLAEARGLVDELEATVNDETARGSR